MIWLDDKERERFAAYLAQEAQSDADMAHLMEKHLGAGHDVGASHLKTNALAKRVVAQWLDGFESQTIQAKDVG